MYIGIRKFVTTPGIEDFRYIIDNTALSYHNVVYTALLEKAYGCMYVYGKDGCCYANGGNRKHGEWFGTYCNLNVAAMCEANKV